MPPHLCFLGRPLVSLLRLGRPVGKAFGRPVLEDVVLGDGDLEAALEAALELLLRGPAQTHGAVTLRGRVLRYSEVGEKRNHEKREQVDYGL